MKEDSDSRSTEDPLYLKWAVLPIIGGEVGDHVEGSGGGCKMKMTSVKAMLRQSERYRLVKGRIKTYVQAFDMESTHLRPYGFMAA